MIRTLIAAGIMSETFHINTFIVLGAMLVCLVAIVAILVAWRQVWQSWKRLGD